MNCGEETPKGRQTLRKVVDDIGVIKCANGEGIIREEVWINVADEVAKYNLAFINTFCGVDNGRIFGYDNAHCVHERHFKGTVTEIEFPGYDALFERFILEVAELRREKV